MYLSRWSTTSYRSVAESRFAVGHRSLNHRRTRDSNDGDRSPPSSSGLAVLSVSAVLAVSSVTASGSPSGARWPPAGARYQRVSVLLWLHGSQTVLKSLVIDRISRTAAELIDFLEVCPLIHIVTQQIERLSPNRIFLRPSRDGRTFRPLSKAVLNRHKAVGITVSRHV